MAAALYTASVPVFRHYLDRLEVLLDRAEAHCAATGRPAAALLDARLSPDMFPFAQQVRTAVSFTVRTSCPLAGGAVPALGGGGEGWPALRDEIAEAVSVLKGLPPEAFDGAEARKIEARAGFADLELDAADFLFLFGLPNFFFHLTAAYTILRGQGVAVSKADFDGFHAYPDGFRFPETV